MPGPAIPFAQGREEKPGFFPPHPPPAFARWLARFMVVLFLAALATAIWLPLPETVECHFVLAPREAADAVSSPAAGSVSEARVKAGDTVRRGELMFRIRSQQALSLASELAQARRETASLAERLAPLRAGFAARLAAARAREASYQGQMAYQKEFLAAHAQVLARMESLAAKKAISPMQLLTQRVEMAKARRDLAAASQALAMARAELTELANQKEREEADLGLALQKARIREAGLAEQLSDTGQGAFLVKAPFDAVVLQVDQGQAGGVVAFGQRLARLAKLSARLEVRLTLPENGLALLKPGQPVRLLLAAFPYMRFGTGAARLAWISPAPLDTPAGRRFLAKAELAGPAPGPGGYRAGMAGTARVKVGKRTMVEYVFEPLRGLKENLASPAFAPAASHSRDERTK